jgi:hypothetical protein
LVGAALPATAIRIQHVRAGCEDMSA